MRRVKFILCVGAILLAGAAAAGVAARSVVEPHEGEVRSAGVVTVPTVLGQTAEELLFYPWSMYDTQPLRKPTEEDLIYGLGLWVYGDSLEEVTWRMNEGERARIEEERRIFLDLFPLLGPLEIQWRDLFEALEWNVGQDGQEPTAGRQIFLKDFPAVLNVGEEAPVVVSFAESVASYEQSVSILMRPAEMRDITEEEQAAALKKVEREVRTLLTEEEPEGIGLYGLLWAFAEHRGGTGSALEQFMETRRENALVLGDMMAEGLPTEELSMEEFLSVADMMGTDTIQIITTQQEIVVLFALDRGNVIGAYYDIQLDCWSGVGLTERN